MNNYKSFLMYKLKEVLVICKKKGGNSAALKFKFINSI